MIAAERKVAVVLGAAAAGSMDSHIGLHGRRMETGSLFAAIPHPVCFVQSELYFVFNFIVNEKMCYMCLLA